MAIHVGPLLTFAQYADGQTLNLVRALKTSGTTKRASCGRENLTKSSVRRAFVLSCRAFSTPGLARPFVRPTCERQEFGLIPNARSYIYVERAARDKDDTQIAPQDRSD